MPIKLLKYFQPKVIIGSLFGIITGVVGFLAVFYPSWFNQETKKIPEYTSTIDAWDGIYDLKKFLIKQAKDKTIFKIHISSPKMDEPIERDLTKGNNSEKILETYEYKPDTDEKNVIINIQIQTGQDVDRWETFVFNDLNFIDSGPVMMSLYTLDGYFTFQSKRGYQGGVEYNFKRVEEGMIRLKNFEQ